MWPRKMSLFSPFINFFHAFFCLYLLSVFITFLPGQKQEYPYMRADTLTVDTMYVSQAWIVWVYKIMTQLHWYPNYCRVPIVCTCRKSSLSTSLFFPTLLILSPRNQPDVLFLSQQASGPWLPFWSPCHCLPSQVWLPLSSPASS